MVEQLEKARQYKAVLALYRIMSRDGYDFYENNVLNGVFKRLIDISVGIDSNPLKLNVPIPTLESVLNNET